MKNEDKALKSKTFLFELDPELIQQTFIGKSPKSRVLLDRSILLDIHAVSETEIQASFNSAQVPDLYLKGLHHLAIEQSR